MFPQCPTPQVSDSATQREFLRIVENLNKILKISMLDGIEIKNITLQASTQLSIPHKLQRKYSGFLITNKNANANVWVSSSTETETYLKLTASAACTIDLWVY